MPLCILSIETKLNTRWTFLKKRSGCFKRSLSGRLTSKKALERIGHTLIECVLDIGNDMIDGFIMRDPGSYDDIMDILTDEKVVSQTEGENLKQLIAYRKPLVQDYLNISHEELEHLLNTHAETIEAFPARIRDYLNHELGPVSAFKPQQ